jgi:hypothetical protein
MGGVGIGVKKTDCDPLDRERRQRADHPLDLVVGEGCLNHAAVPHPFAYRDHQLPW